MQISITKAGYQLTFNRTVVHRKSKRKPIVASTDVIRLTAVKSVRHDTELDPAAYRQGITLQQWNEILHEVRFRSCGICGDASPLGRCPNERYHSPNKKP